MSLTPGQRLGSYEIQAVSMLEAALGLSRRASSALASLATVFGHWGKPSEAIALHRELMDRAPRAFRPTDVPCPLGGGCRAA
jgi:hypothetical protein